MLDGHSRNVTEPLIHEDSRQGSGHMQINYPAPLSGLFEPAVQLGQQIKQGEMLGRLSDPFTGENEEISASETGAVVVLRTYPQVNKDDALAVILQDERELPPI